MDPRTPSEVEATGTLPLSGDGSVPLTEEEPTPTVAARPDWVEESRAGLTVPGKYLAYEDAGRRVVAPVSREWTRIGRSLSSDSAPTLLRKRARSNPAEGEATETMVSSGSPPGTKPLPIGRHRVATPLTLCV